MFPLGCICSKPLAVVVLAVLAFNIMAARQQWSETDTTLLGANVVCGCALIVLLVYNVLSCLCGWCGRRRRPVDSLYDAQYARARDKERDEAIADAAVRKFVECERAVRPAASTSTLRATWKERVSTLIANAPVGNRFSHQLHCECPRKCTHIEMPDGPGRSGLIVLLEHEPTCDCACWTYSYEIPVHPMQ